PSASPSHLPTRTTPSPPHLPPPPPRSLPTRRSSDLACPVATPPDGRTGRPRAVRGATGARDIPGKETRDVPRPRGSPHGPGSAGSEEDTSELQSRSDLVCRLFLEKNK